MTSRVYTQQEFVAQDLIKDAIDAERERIAAKFVVFLREAVGIPEVPAGLIAAQLTGGDK